MSGHSDVEPTDPTTTAMTDTNTSTSQALATDICAPAGDQPTRPASGRTRRNAAAATIGVTAALTAAALAPGAVAPQQASVAAIEPDTGSGSPTATPTFGEADPAGLIALSGTAGTTIEQEEAVKQALDRSVNRTSRSTSRGAPDPDEGAPKLTEDEAPTKQKASAAPEKAAAARAPEAAQEAPPEAVGVRYTTTALNVRTAPDSDANLVTVLDAGTKVQITSDNTGQWQQIVRGDQARWVREDFLSRQRPDSDSSDSAGDSGGISAAPCASGSGMEGPLTANAIRVHRAVCARFPQVSSYGGWRPGGGNHGSGRAVDIMVSGSTGTQIANWVRANAGRLGVSEVIWSQHIWTVQRAGEGWRGMPDRGSVTDNHYDHVHVSVY